MPLGGRRFAAVLSDRRHTLCWIEPSSRRMGFHVFAHDGLIASSRLDSRLAAIRSFPRRLARNPCRFGSPRASESDGSGNCGSRVLFGCLQTEATNFRFIAQIHRHSLAMHTTIPATSKSDQQDGAPIAQRNVRRSNSPRRSVWSALNRREIGRRRGIRCGTRYGGWCQPRMLPEWPHPK